MSTQSTVVTVQHFRYLAERTRREDAFLSDLRRAAKEASLPAIHIAPEQASFLQILLRLHGAREVIEVGTLGGYSAIAMARALPEGGRVRTIELNAAFAEFARSWVARSDVADRVEVIEGRGMDVLPTFPTDSADATFLDADKASYPDYLRESLRIVRPGGLFCVDNAFAFGQLFDEHPTDPEVEAVRTFNDFMAGVEELQSVIVPLGDGCWVGVKT
jgi:predicted O-methyltransferase YrrM